MRRIFLALALSALVAPTVAEAKKAPALTPMQVQALQSREFETTKENLFAASMTVMQDLGYQVQSADLQTGFITAVSATQNKTNFWEALGGGRSSGNTKVTVFIMNLPNGMARVRLNFLNTKILSTAYGQSSQDDKPILDAQVYTNTWDKIDEALFVMGALVASPPVEVPAGAKPAADEPVKPAESKPESAPIDAAKLAT
ncbi:MAG: hypothetical protein ACREBO_02470 [Novosphingobium sp.]